MENNITNNLKILDSVLESLVDQWYFLYTDKIIVKDGQIAVNDVSCYGNKYINYFIDIKEFFSSIKIWENQFIKYQDLNEFCKKFLAIHDKLVFAAFSKRSEEILSNLNHAEKLFKDARPKMLPDKFSNQQDFDISISIVQKYLNGIKPLRSNFERVYQQGKEQLKAEYKLLYTAYFNRLLTFWEQCESPLEKAFLLGIIAYDPFTIGWMYEDRFYVQHKVNKYRLDFAFINKNQNISIAMEVDGHNYHERTESQAVNDRRRDRFLTKKGWRVLRFHRQEIESDLSACMQQVKQVYSSLR